MTLKAVLLEQLRSVLEPDAHRRTATEYRDLVCRVTQGDRP